MSNDNSYLTDRYLEKLEALTGAIRGRDGERIDELVSELTTLRESHLYRELGMLTREIHDTLRGFANDERIAELAQEDIPDAKERLNFIVTKTDDAAHRTMAGAEETIARVSAFNERAQQLHGRWRQFRNRELSREQFVELNRDLDDFLRAMDDEAVAINGKMTEIMLAQDYQDITGQMIKQVVAMVQEVEEKLVRLVTLSGVELRPGAARPNGEVIAEGPQLPTASKDTVAQSQGDVDDLLASLGF